MAEEPVLSTLPRPAEMYRAIVRRDAGYEGVFITGVKTTGIFCRPTCPSRKPRPSSVEFFANPREALLAGYRPCKRCKPMDDGTPPDWVRTLMDHIERNPGARLRAEDLRDMNIQPARASRWFKQHYGMTFQAYHRSRRLGSALAVVRNGRVNGSSRKRDLTRVGLDHGFESTSGFRDAFARVFGSAPGKAADASCLVARWIETPLGPMLALAGDEGLCLLEYVDRRMLQTQLETLRRRFGCAVLPQAGRHRHLDAIADELQRYFAGSLREFKTPLVLRGTPFQLKVWNRLKSIPYGHTLSYAQMARDIGVKDAQRAVGRANGDNRLAIILACHRVIRSDGSLCGYGGGLWRKKWLLEHERKHAAATGK